MGAVVLDASVVIGHLADDDVHHHACSQVLREHATGDLALPASAYAEVLVRPHQTGRVDLTREAIDALGIRVEPIGREIAECAAALRARFPSLRLPDALVLGHADAIGADAVLTTDRRWTRFSPRVQVVG